MHVLNQHVGWVVSLCVSHRERSCPEASSTNAGKQPDGSGAQSDKPWPLGGMTSACRSSAKQQQRLISSFESNLAMPHARLVPQQAKNCCDF